MKSSKTYFLVVPIVGALLMVLALEFQSLLLPDTADADNAAIVAQQNRAPLSSSDLRTSEGSQIFLGPKTGRKETNNNSSKLPKTPEVQVLVAAWCPYCRKLEDFLKKNGIAYSRLDIEKSVKAAELYKRLGSGGVPITKIGDSVIRGYDPNAIMRALRRYPQGTSKL